MRARMALAVSAQRCVIREVVLRDKPPCMLGFSAKGTVPVLVFPDGRVVDESLDIMKWALSQNDPKGWLDLSTDAIDAGDGLIAYNDGEFKDHLDRTKYPNRYAEVDPLYHRGEAEFFLHQLNDQLAGQSFLFGESVTISDIAIFPFIRQLANHNRIWFDGCPLPNLQSWLAGLLQSDIFLFTMAKYPQWRDGDPVTWFPALTAESAPPNAV